MDHATATAILALQLQDIEELSHDNTLEIGDNDAALTRQIYHEDLKRQAVHLLLIELTFGCNHVKYIIIFHISYHRRY